MVAQYAFSKLSNLGEKMNSSNTPPIAWNVTTYMYVYLHIHCTCIFGILQFYNWNTVMLARQKLNLHDLKLTKSFYVILLQNIFHYIKTILHLKEKSSCMLFFNSEFLCLNLQLVECLPNKVQSPSSALAECSVYHR